MPISSATLAFSRPNRESPADEWSVPVNLGENLNTAADETRPSLSWDGTTLYFGSPGPAPIGEGMSDVYVSTRTRRGK